MRTALQDSIPRQRAGTSTAVHSAAPTGGWNTRDSLVNMDSRDALVLDNWFPQASEVWQRGGSAVFASGMTGNVKSMASYNPTTGTKKFLAFTDAGVYDISAGGVVGGLMAGSAFTNGYVQTLTMTNSAGTTFLWVCNEVDTPKVWDGAAWSVAAVTGLTSTNIAQAWIFKHRIWFVEKGTMNAWYLPIDSIQGAASQYPMGNLFRLGGYLVAGTNWTLEGGDGPDDALAVITSEGELAVFQGTDPNSSSSWSLAGIYYVGKPLGRKCFFKLGGDVGLITENGVFPLSRALQLGSINFASALTNKIQPSCIAAAIAGGVTTQGYEGCVYPRFNALVINLPNQVVGNSLQFVMNTVTGQWCSFSGWNALSFLVFDGQLYFSTLGGKVYKCWDGLLPSDSGSDITATVWQAYQYFGSSARMKKLKLMRFLMGYDGNLDMKWCVAADYDDATFTSSLPDTVLGTAAVWNTASWDTSYWATDITRYKGWKNIAHVTGYALSLRMITNGNNNSAVKWAGTDFIVDSAGLM